MFKKLREKLELEKIETDCSFDAKSLDLTIIFKRSVTLLSGDKIVITHEDLAPILGLLDGKNSS